MAELKLNINQTSNEAFTDLLVYSGYPRQYTGSEYIEVLELTPEGTDGTTTVKLKIKGDLATKLVDTGNIGYEDKGDHKIVVHKYRRVDYAAVLRAQSAKIKEQTSLPFHYVNEFGYSSFASGKLTDIGQLVEKYKESVGLSAKPITATGQISTLTFGSAGISYTLPADDKALYKNENLPICYTMVVSKVDNPAFYAVSFIKPSITRMKQNEFYIPETRNWGRRNDMRNLFGEKQNDEYFMGLSFINSLINEGFGKEEGIADSIQAFRETAYEGARKQVIQELHQAWKEGAAQFTDVAIKSDFQVDSTSTSYGRTETLKDYEVAYKNQEAIEQDVASLYKVCQLNAFSGYYFSNATAGRENEAMKKMVEKLHAINPKVGIYRLESTNDYVGINQANTNIPNGNPFSTVYTIVRPLDDLLLELKDTLSSEGISKVSIENASGKQTLVLEDDAFKTKEQAVAKATEVVNKITNNGANGLQHILDIRQIEETDGDGSVEIWVDAKTTGAAKYLVSGSVRINVHYEPTEVRPQGNLTGFAKPEN